MLGSALILSHDTIYETALRSIPQIKSGTVRTPFIPPDFRIKNINFRLRISVYASSSTSRIPIDLRNINIDRRLNRPNSTSIAGGSSMIHLTITNVHLSTTKNKNKNNNHNR